MKIIIRKLKIVEGFRNCILENDKVFVKIYNSWKIRAYLEHVSRWRNNSNVCVSKWKGEIKGN